jgi:RHS repeat-associated protein
LTHSGFEYDAADRLTVEVHTLGDRVTRIDHTYDVLDRRTRRVVSSAGPGGSFGPDITEYTYDLDDRLTAVVYRGDGSREDRTTYVWDADNRLAARTLANGIAVSHSHDAASRLTALEYRRLDGTVIERLTYDYDAQGQITSRGSVNPISEPETPLTATYDAADRMTGVTLYPGSAQQASYALTYDGEGNLIEKVNTADAADRVIYRWDSRNRLVQLDAAGLTASFSYDAIGRRVERLITRAGAPVNATQYVYDGAQAVGELRLAQGTTTAQNSTLITGLALDEALARVTRTAAETPQLRAYVTDHLGSVLAQTREDQSIASGSRYSAYGETATSGEVQAGDLGYTARENDGTGLYFYRARYYDPVLKRFVSSDPIGLDGGLNTYTYVLGNPLAYADPTGENPAAAVAAAIAAALAAARQAIIRCARDAACRCRAIYGAYKAICGIGCNGKSCAVLTVQARAAMLCYQLRTLYVTSGCDRVIPTTRDHPGAAQQAKRAWENCERRRDLACCK